MPREIPGHRYANAIELDPTGRVRGRPLNTRAAPFAMTAATGTAERYAERTQAHKDRILILKASHARTRQLAKGQAKTVRGLETALARKTKSLALAGAKFPTIKDPAARARAEVAYQQLQIDIMEIKDDLKDERERDRGMKKHLGSLEREVNKLKARIPKNAAKERRARK